MNSGPKEESYVNNLQSQLVPYQVGPGMQEQTSAVHLHLHIAACHSLNRSFPVLPATSIKTFLLNKRASAVLIYHLSSKCCLENDFPLFP